jgi:protein phosphatase
MLTFRAGSASDVGGARPHNEDCAPAGDGICVVADGMGGHAAGEIAGRPATEALGEALAGRDLVSRGSPWPPR